MENSAHRRCTAFCSKCYDGYWRFDDFYINTEVGLQISHSYQFDNMCIFHHNAYNSSLWLIYLRIFGKVEHFFEIGNPWDQIKKFLWKGKKVHEVRFAVGWSWKQKNMSPKRLTKLFSILIFMEYFKSKGHPTCA